MEMVVAMSDKNNCFKEDNPLPLRKLLGVCNFTFIPAVPVFYLLSISGALPPTGVFRLLYNIRRQSYI